MGGKNHVKHKDLILTSKILDGPAPGTVYQGPQTKRRFILTLFLFLGKPQKSYILMARPLSPPPSPSN